MVCVLVPATVSSASSSISTLDLNFRNLGDLKLVALQIGLVHNLPALLHPPHGAVNTAKHLFPAQQEARDPGTTRSELA